MLTIKLIIRNFNPNHLKSKFFKGISAKVMLTGLLLSFLSSLPCIVVAQEKPNVHLRDTH